MAHPVVATARQDKEQVNQVRFSDGLEQILDWCHTGNAGAQRQEHRPTCSFCVPGSSIPSVAQINVSSSSLNDTSVFYPGDLSPYRDGIHSFDLYMSIACVVMEYTITVYAGMADMVEWNVTGCIGHRAHTCTHIFATCLYTRRF